MRGVLRKGLAGGALLWAMAWAPAALAAATLQGRVIAVVSGEVFDMQLASGDVASVHLAGVASAQAGEEEDDVQAAAARREALRGLIQGQTVRVNVTGQDREGRNLGVAWVSGAPQDVAQTLIAQGLLKRRAAATPARAVAPGAEPAELSRDEALALAAKPAQPEPRSARALNGYFEDKKEPEPEDANYPSFAGLRGASGIEWWGNFGRHYTLPRDYYYRYYYYRYKYRYRPRSRYQE